MSDEAQAVVDQEIQVLDQKMDATEEVVEELDFAVTETAGEGGVVENLEAIAIDLQSILASGGSLDGAGFRMFNHAMDSNLRRIGLDHKPNMPSMESFDDSVTSRGATRIAMEGVFSAIGDALKKIWEWIIGIFKGIGQFFGFGKTQAEKQEDKKSVIIEELKKLDGGKKVKIKLTPEQVKQLSIKGKLQKKLADVVSDYANMTAISNHDSIMMTDACFKLSDDGEKIFEDIINKDLPVWMKKLSAADSEEKAQEVFETALAEMKTKFMLLGAQFIQTVHNTKGKPSAVRNKRKEKLVLLQAGKLHPDQPEIAGDIDVAELSGGLEIGIMAADLSKVPKQAMDKIKEKIGGIDLSFISKLASVVFVRTIPSESKEAEIELSISDIIKYNVDFSEVIKATFSDSEYDKKVNTYVSRLEGSEKKMTGFIEKIEKAMESLPAEERNAASMEMRKIQGMVRSFSGTIIDVYKKAMMSVKEYNSHALRVNGVFVAIANEALKQSKETKAA